MRSGLKIKAAGVSVQDKVENAGPAALRRGFPTLYRVKTSRY